MKTTFISTPALFQSSRTDLMRLQDELAVRQQEMTSGRHADMGLSLGARLSRTISLRNDHDRLSRFVDTNNLVASRLDLTQTTLGGLRELAEDFLATLISVKDGESVRPVAAQAARAALGQMTTLVNTTMNGAHLFAGINTGQSPLEDYFADPAGTGKMAVDTAFQGAFGFDQSDPAVSGISAGDMAAFVSGPFANLFDSSNWEANFSTASNTDITSRIADHDQIRAGTNANEEAFRQLAGALIMVADLGTEDLNQNAFSSLADAAIETVGNAITGLIGLQGSIGMTQERVERATTSQELELDILNHEIVTLETVDPYETATRVNQLMSQIEASFALTSRLSRMSLVNRI